MSYFFSGRILFCYIITCAAIIILLTLKREGKDRILYAVLSLIFFTYLYFLIDITQFPIYITQGMKEALGGDIWASIHLVPFENIINFSSFANIIIMMPIGFLIPLMSVERISHIKLIIIALMPGILIEFLQLIQLLLIGYTLRIIDINDIICNFAGVLAGYIVFKSVKKAVENLSVKFNAKDNYIIKYFSVR